MADKVVITNSDADSDFEIKHNLLVKYHGHGKKDIIIPEGIHTIGYEAFGDSNYSVCIANGFDDFLDLHSHREIETVTFPNSLRKIDRFAFCGCDKLKKALNTSKIEYVGPGAFTGTQISEFDISGFKAFNGGLGNKIKDLDLTNCNSISEGSLMNVNLRTLRLSKSLIEKSRTKPFIDHSSFSGSRYTGVQSNIEKLYIDGKIIDQNDPILLNPFFEGTSLYEA